MTTNSKQVAGDHYKTPGIQHWDMIHNNDIGYLAGNATKYLTRFRRKSGLQDLEKALHYVEKMIESYSKFIARSCGDVPPLELETFFADNNIVGAERTPIRLILNWSDISDLNLARTWVEILIAEYEGSSAGSNYVHQD